MTPKQYLSQYQRAYRTVRLAARQLEQAEHDAAGVRAILYSDMPKSHNVERDLSDAMTKIEELAAVYRDTVKASTAIMSEVAAVIMRVPDKTQMEILWLRYVDGLKWEEIAEKMGYGREWVCRVHGKALQSIHRKEVTESHI